MRRALDGGGSGGRVELCATVSLSLSLSVPLSLSLSLSLSIAAVIVSVSVVQWVKRECFVFVIYLRGGVRVCVCVGGGVQEMSGRSGAAYPLPYHESH